MCEIDYYGYITFNKTCKHNSQNLLHFSSQNMTIFSNLKILTCRIPITQPIIKSKQYKASHLERPLDTKKIANQE